jgi:hypothetical protein
VISKGGKRKSLSGLLAPERRITTGYPALLGCSTSSNANVHLRRSEAHYAPPREFNSRLGEAMLRNIVVDDDIRKTLLVDSLRFKDRESMVRRATPGL